MKGQILCTARLISPLPHAAFNPFVTNVGYPLKIILPTSILLGARIPGYTTISISVCTRESKLRMLLRELLLKLTMMNKRGSCVLVEGDPRMLKLFTRRKLRLGCLIFGRVLKAWPVWTSAYGCVGCIIIIIQYLIESCWLRASI